MLLDECVPRKLKLCLSDCDCPTVTEVGWAGKKNGELLALAESHGFEILLTMDKGVEYEQNLAGRKIAIIVLRAKSNRLADLVTLVPGYLAEMRIIPTGRVARIGIFSP